MPDVLVITLMGKGNLKYVRGNCFSVGCKMRAVSSMKSSLQELLSIFEMKWAVHGEEVRGGVFGLTCPCNITRLCLCNGNIDEGKDCGLMREGRC